jgi:amidophosphoribosyltransferase
MPTRTELIAHNKTPDEVGQTITADKVIYQDLEALEQSVQRSSEGRLSQFDASCFNGVYITGDIDTAYLDALECGKKEAKAAADLLKVGGDDEQ